MATPSVMTTLASWLDAARPNAVPHSGKAYAPSHVGRLIHGDLAGPFKRSQHGFTYFLVLVYDHSRFKQVYFLKHKDEAPRSTSSTVMRTTVSLRSLPIASSRHRSV